MNKKLTIIILTLFMLSPAFSGTNEPEKIIYLYCGDFGVDNPVKKDVFKTPQVQISVNNQTDTFFLVIDFDKKKMSQYPPRYGSDAKPLFDESKKQSTRIAPISNKTLDSQGVLYMTWASSNLSTNLDEYIYISSKIKMLGKEDYFGGLLTKVETAIIDNNSGKPHPPIKASVTVKQYLCSKVFDFSKKLTK